jgi:rubredoxin-NAD+ reductase
MAKWECTVCGWIYDESRGDPENGVVAGTPWAEVPEDWLCPDCGVGKEDFAIIDEVVVDTVPHHEIQQGVDLAKAPLVIIGSGLAGYGLLKEFRKHDKDTPLIVVTSDDGRSYSKPMLSTGFTKNNSADDLVQLDAGSLGEQFDASVWTMTQVKIIDTTRQMIKLGDAETSIHYSKLVLALGADTITPPIDGDGQEYIYSINDLLDYQDFRRAIAQNEVRKIVVIGAGLIGCEYANDLLNGGFEVELVDPMGYCLPTLLPEAAGQAVQRALESLGARFHFGPLVTAVNKYSEGSGVRVCLNNGETLEADLVLSAVGVRPRTALAKAAGIECNRGVMTNRLLETSAAGVYALGDCAEVAGHALVFVAPLMAAARALGKTLAGEATLVKYPAMPVTIKTPVCPVVVSPPPMDAEGSWQIQQQNNNVVAEYRNTAGELLGFALTGEGSKQKMRLQKELPPVLA